MSRRNRVLAVVFLLLAGLALAVEQPWRGDAFARTEAQVHRLFPELAALREQIFRVEIQSRGRQTTLSRVADGFVVEEKLAHPADLGRLIALVDSLCWLDDRDVVSDNPEKRATFQVEADSGTRVRLLDRQGAPLADLIGGALRNAPEQAGEQALLEFYVRRADRDQVLLAPEFRPPPADPAQWIQPRLFPGLQAGQIQWLQRLGAEAGDSWKVVRSAEAGGEPAWRVVAPEPGAAAAHEAEGLAFTFAGLRAEDVAARLVPGGEPGADFGFPGETFRAGAGEASLEVRLGKPAEAGRRYAWVPGSPYVVLVGEFAAERLRVPADRF